MCGCALLQGGGSGVGEDKKLELSEYITHTGSQLASDLSYVQKDTNFTRSVLRNFFLHAQESVVASLSVFTFLKHIYIPSKGPEEIICCWEAIPGHG